MSKTYHFQYKDKTEYVKATNYLLPSTITLTSLLLADLIIHTIIMCNEKYIPLGISITSLILFILISIITFTANFRFFYFFITIPSPLFIGISNKK